MALVIKSVKKPVRLKDLGFWFASQPFGRTYGPEDLVSVEDANNILECARKQRLAQQASL